MAQCSWPPAAMRAFHSVTAFMPYETPQERANSCCAESPSMPGRPGRACLDVLDELLLRGANAKASNPVRRAGSARGVGPRAAAR
jgi:hypothetical protein